MPFLVIPIILFIIYQLAIVVSKSFSTEKTIAELQRQADDLEATTKRLRELNEFLNGDFFAEKESRMRLSMQKPGERVVVVQENGSDASARVSVGRQSASSRSFTAEKSNPFLWFEYFFGS